MRDVFEFLVTKNKDIITNNGSIDPVVTVVLYDKQKGINLLPISLSDTDSPMERKLLLSSLARYMAEDNLKVEMFISIAEAWASKISKEEYKGEGYVRPSLDPRRVEALVAGAVDSDGNVADAFFEIQRGGSKVSLVPLDADLDRKSTSDNGKVIWKTRVDQSVNGAFNSLLETAWSEYRRHKSLIKKSDKK